MTNDKKFPSIETDRMISRAQGLTQFLIETPDASTTADVLQRLSETLQEARKHFRDTLNEHREEKMKMIKSCASASNTR